MTTFNVYCDESCHLENDHQRAMVIGALLCPASRAREVADDIRLLKRRHGLARDFEMKWTKVSPAKVAFYRNVLEYFFSDNDLRFRAIVVPDKTLLRHDAFRQDQDTFYYKMYFAMLKSILTRDAAYRIYLDVKDTRSAAKERTLHDVLCSNLRDFGQQIVKSLQSVRSHEVEQIQLADLLVGAASYANRDLHGSTAKSGLVKEIEGRAGYRLTSSTPLSERKLNIFIWRAEPVSQIRV